ncbi:imidazoleglycerol-phosphate dehydratase HisB [Clostridium aestuarii]|uniref:Imidazoleglycerol-phosphate dehydratase n=1 Tax=Clostridium aestuarii TaxID=338193 RepID=A0ABT4CV67_9CLOT|nr:imidazoleglycerol-phosphate dehydratase HisB [Clostridium aestuarii]MCY6482882.1 imidazoleglycerol-phosphate dehydratase HisB [Clostridium aestuarii]
MRNFELNRDTFETSIKASLNIDGHGESTINTGIGFFDHMLTLFAKHGFFDLTLNTIGDIHVDSHHTIEDVGIVLGQCIKNALGDKNGIKRYGTSYLPMDETLALVSLDISNRPFLVFDANFTTPKLGDYDTEMTEEFFRALAFNAGITLHIKILHGTNNHHMIEAIFKAFARALNEATTIDNNIKGVLSSKGSL